MEVVAFSVGVIGLVFGVYCGWRVWNWERTLAGARVAVAFKGKVKMDPTLLDVLRWARVLSKDKRNNGQVFYKMGGTTIAVLKPRRLTGKTQVRTAKEKK